MTAGLISAAETAAEANRLPAQRTPVSRADTRTISILPMRAKAAAQALTNSLVGRHRPDRRRPVDHPSRSCFGLSIGAGPEFGRLPTATTRLCAKRARTASQEWRIPAPHRLARAGLRLPVQLNSEETLSSLAMRPIASPMSGAIEITR